MRQKPPPAMAQTAAARIRSNLGSDAKIGLILGTGWGDTLKLSGQRELPFRDVASVFEGLPQLEGHSRSVVYGQLDGTPVLALRGRIHLNEAPCDPDMYDMVRTQVAMLIEAGVRRLIITSAVGSLRGHIAVGDIVQVSSLMTLCAPPMPLYAGEFVSPEDVIDFGAHPRIRRANDRHWKIPLAIQVGCHGMVRGPFFEGRRKDKQALASLGADIVGMSLLPELCVAGLYNQGLEDDDPNRIWATPLMYVTNGPTERHEHESNQTQAKSDADHLGELLSRVVGHFS